MSRVKNIFTSFALGISLCVLPGQALAANYYTVQPGDSLWEIAQTCRSTVNKIQSLNNLTSTILHPGKKLLISGPSDSSKYDAPAQKNIVSVNSVANTGVYYTVRQGDSLWKIAREYGTTVDKMQALNNLTGTTLYAGQRLMISGANVLNPTVAPAPPVSRSADRHAAVIEYAKSFIGVPYASAGSSPRGFDCSGYVKYVFSHFGISLPRNAADQYRRGKTVGSGNAGPGDLVAFKSGGYISHIGIYLGGGKFISATSSRGVVIDSVYSSYWGKRFLGFSRILP